MILDISLKVVPPASPELVEYLGRFSNSRRMKRDANKIKDLDHGKGLEFCYKGEAGVEGEFYAKPNHGGNIKDESVISCNEHPSTQPGLWCDFKATTNGNFICCDNFDDVQDEALWIEYLIKNFFKPNGYTISGDMTYEVDGEQYHMVVVNNDIEIFSVNGTITMEKAKDVAKKIILKAMSYGDNCKGELIELNDECLEQCSDVLVEGLGLTFKVE